MSGILVSSCASDTVLPEPEGSAVTVVYVSADADSGNANGTINEPFSTIEEARDYLRTKNIGRNNHGIIYLRAGSYHISDNIPLYFIKTIIRTRYVGSDEDAGRNGCGLL